MDGVLQQAMTAVKGYQNVNTFITIVYLGMGKLEYLPQNPVYKLQESR